MATSVEHFGQYPYSRSLPPGLPPECSVTTSCAWHLGHTTISCILSSLGRHYAVPLNVSARSGALGYCRVFLRGTGYGSVSSTSAYDRSKAVGIAQCTRSLLSEQVRDFVRRSKPYTAETTLQMSTSRRPTRSSPVMTYRDSLCTWKKGKEVLAIRRAGSAVQVSRYACTATRCVTLCFVQWLIHHVDW